MTNSSSLDASAFHIYDTTLRDGAQQEGLNLSVQDKLNIAKHLDSCASPNIIFPIYSFFPALNSKINDFMLISPLAASKPNALALTKRDLNMLDQWHNLTHCRYITAEFVSDDRASYVM